MDLKYSEFNGDSGTSINPFVNMKEYESKNDKLTRNPNPSQNPIYQKTVRMLLLDITPEMRHMILEKLMIYNSSFMSEKPSRNSILDRNNDSDKNDVPDRSKKTRPSRPTHSSRNEFRDFENFIRSKHSKQKNHKIPEKTPKKSALELELDAINNLSSKISAREHKM